MEARGETSKMPQITSIKGEGEPSVKQLVEVKEDCMVVMSHGSNVPTYSTRKGAFLRSLEPQAAIVPLQNQAPARVNLDRPTIYFKGWPPLSKNWVLWVDKLEPIHGKTWKQLGIYDAIQATTHKLNKHPYLILGAACFWCSSTNTFLFPWGEVTVTLEDVMILGGLPVVGESLAPIMWQARSTIGETTDPLECQILFERKKVCRGSTTKKAEFGAWSKHFMDLDGDVEHAAFLAVWLSRFLFPVESPASTVRLDMLSLAIRLARGTRVALAPSILAILYRDLGVLKSHMLQAMGRRNDGSMSLLLWAPFNLLQLWLWERFGELRPSYGGEFVAGMPRMVRWSNCCCNVAPGKVISILARPKEFQWRPYAQSSGIRPEQSFYTDVGRWCRTPCSVNGSEVDSFLELISFGACLKSTSLTGVDCIEAYNPHRVAMQFGYDQDVPGYECNYKQEVPVVDTCADAVEDVEFYLMPRLYHPHMTQRYSTWWRKHMLSCVANQIVYDWDEGVEGSSSGSNSTRRTPHLFDLNHAEPSNSPTASTSAVRMDPQPPPLGTEVRSLNWLSMNRNPQMMQEIRVPSLWSPASRNQN